MICLKDRLHSFDEDKILDIAWEYAERGDIEMAENLISLTRKEIKQNHRIAFVIAGIYFQLGNFINFAKFFRKGIKLALKEEYHNLDFDFYQIANKYLIESRIVVFIEYIKEVQKLGESGLEVIKGVLHFDCTKYKSLLIKQLETAQNIMNKDKESSLYQLQILTQSFAKLTERESVNEVIAQLTSSESRIELYNVIVDFTIENDLNEESWFYLRKMGTLIESLKDEKKRMEWRIKLKILSNKSGDDKLNSEIKLNEPREFSDNYFEYLLVSNQIENAMKYISGKEDLENKLPFCLMICSQIIKTNTLDQYPTYLENTWSLLRELPDEELENKSKYLEEFTLLSAQSGNKELTELVVERYIKLIHHPDTGSYFDIDQIENYIKILLDAGASHLAKRVMSERDVVYETWSIKKQMLIEKTDSDNYQLNLFIKNNQLKELAGFVNEKIPDDLKRYYYVDLALQYAKLKNTHQPPWEEISEIVLDSL